MGIHKDISLGAGSETLNGFFVPSSPPFDVVVDSGSAHVHAEQDVVVGWRGENGLVGNFGTFGFRLLAYPACIAHGGYI